MRALLVDLDDTLLDYSGGVDDCWLEACSALAAPVGIDPNALMEAIVRARRWFWSDPERHRLERVDMEGAWRKIMVAALEALGAPDEPLAASIARDFSARRFRCMSLFPGVVDVLDRLRQRGVPLALVTNGDARHQRRKIAQHDLARFFDAIVIEGEFGVGKPHESVYHHVLGVLGVTPPEAWMVGDNLEWDVLAPQRLGLRGAWIDSAGEGLPTATQMRPHVILRAFTEILDALDLDGGAGKGTAAGSSKHDRERPRPRRKLGAKRRPRV
jgi:putative hydrolase of the HAD superfamily